MTAHLIAARLASAGGKSVMYASEWEGVEYHTHDEVEAHAMACS